jgi:putative membrane protein insertion efficiency factor
MDRIGLLPRRLLIGLVTLYRLLISPVLAPSCRYWPSCSEYAVDALRTHGALHGGWLTLRRLCRCNPWAAGGIDPVPPAASFVRQGHPCQCGPGRDPSDSPFP